MSKIDGRYIKVDGVTIEHFNNGILRQVPGTDGGGGGGTGNFVEESIPVNPTFADFYVDLALEPTDHDSLQLFVLDVGGSKSAPQIRNKDFTLVRDTVGGDFKRIAWNSLSAPGGSVAIPDGSDTAPTLGLTDTLLTTDTLLIKYVV